MEVVYIDISVKSESVFTRKIIWLELPNVRLDLKCDQRNRMSPQIPSAASRFNDVQQKFNCTVTGIRCELFPRFYPHLNKMWIEREESWSEWMVNANNENITTLWLRTRHTTALPVSIETRMCATKKLLSDSKLKNQFDLGICGAATKKSFGI